ncbi:MAG: hypothetical protein K1X67_26650 [Fimbriimonadaceae bacterium]|nr:hypothetical protein [Fimbriimonadaceae bacterium]
MTERKGGRSNRGTAAGREVDPLSVLPREMVVDRGVLKYRFAASARARGIAEAEVAAALHELPPTLAIATCFLDATTNHWRYVFGEPLHKDGWVFVGTHMFIEVEKLVSAIFCARARLEGAKRVVYLKRLGMNAKHRDTLTEMRPMLDVPSGVGAEFEVPGLTVGNTTLDWDIVTHEGRHVLLEVKTRIRDLVESLGTNASPVRAPSHDIGLLFRGVIEKLRPRDPSTFLQGCWIFSELRQERSELRAYFDATDSAKLHFAIVGGWSDQALILARRSEDQATIAQLFQVRHDENTGFDRNSTGADVR